MTIIGWLVGLEFKIHCFCLNSKLLNLNILEPPPLSIHLLRVSPFMIFIYITMDLGRYIFELVILRDYMAFYI